MTAATTRAGLINTGTTTLYHEVTGSGPPLLLITGGTGDAGDWAAVVPALAEAFTVVTYDRRGFSRSPRAAGWTSSSAAEHAGDAAALLRTLDLAPAVVVGHSSGASIACHLVAYHPEVVRHAVLYEPPLLAVVPGGRELAAGLRVGAEEAVARGGPRLAMEAFMRGNAGDEAFEAWTAATPPAERDRILDNGAVLFPVELPWVATFVPDRERMRSSRVPLTVVSGTASRGSWFAAAATWLADGTGADHAELPGGHAGHVTDPRALVSLVRDLA